MDWSAAAGFWTTITGVSELPNTILSEIGPSSENSYLHLEESQSLGLEIDWSPPTGFPTTLTGVSELMFSEMDLLPLVTSTHERNTVRNGQTYENDQLHPIAVPSASIGEPQEPVSQVPYGYSPILPSVSTDGFKHPTTHMLNADPVMLDSVEGPSTYWQDTTAHPAIMPATAAHTPNIFPCERFPSNTLEAPGPSPLNPWLIPLPPNDPGPTFAREHIKPDIDYLARQRHSLAVKRNAQLMCMHCQRTFNDKSNVKRHGITCKRNRSLNSNKRYRCTYPHCEASYTRSDNLEAHQRRKKHRQDGG
jgi:hypothetical protein